MKRRRTFESDTERIEAKVAALPSYRFCVPTLRGFAPNASAHELRVVCGRLDVDVSACLERADFAKALKTCGRLDRACALERVGGEAERCARPPPRGAPRPRSAPSAPPTFARASG